MRREMHMDNGNRDKHMDRRRFLRATAAAGASWALAPRLVGQMRRERGPDDINVALLGAGGQGLALMSACRRMGGVRFKAVCDIWQAYNLRRAERLLQHYGHAVNAYVDYEDMLASEKDLDAVIIATPDFWHAQHTVACLDAGLHVYCETAMSNTLEGARRMVEAARRTDKLLQIGHQRRSNPRYIFCYEKLLKEVKLLGQIVAVNGQWNRAAHPPLGWPKRAEIDPATLKKYGYESMTHLRNWRWYKGLGGGPVVELGSHQIDVYNWFLDTRPISVLASGRTNYHDRKTHEWYDTVMAVYEYDAPQGAVTASYRTITASRHDGHLEEFLGDKGALVISERSDRTRLYPEWVGPGAAAWAPCVEKGYLTASPEWRTLLEKYGMTLADFAGLLVDPSPEPVVEPISCELPVTMDMPVHQPHLENFFDAIRGKAKLTCPGEVGYETAVSVLRINEAIEAGRKLSFKPQDFVV